MNKTRGNQGLTHMNPGHQIFKLHKTTVKISTICALPCPVRIIIRWPTWPEVTRVGQPICAQTSQECLQKVWFNSIKREQRYYEFKLDVCTETNTDTHLVIEITPPEVGHLKTRAWSVRTQQRKRTSEKSEKLTYDDNTQILSKR